MDCLIEFNLFLSKNLDANVAIKYTAKPKELMETFINPVKTKLNDDGAMILDFGKAAFGTLLISASQKTKLIVVHLGEQLNSDGRIEREPQGTIRYIRIEQLNEAMKKFIRIDIPRDERNTGPGAIRMPDHIGEVYPFRYAEIENASDLNPVHIKQIMVHYPFDDEASYFESNDKSLNDVWELCKYSIKATTFCGVYVDGDRERVPYEGDAYINQLSHYCVDSEYEMARYTHEYLIQHPTWPTEWNLFCVLNAWEDYMYTGQRKSLECFYDDLKSKTLIGLARSDGLISTESELCTKEFEERLHMHSSDYIFNHGLTDLVDWPPGSFTGGGQGERDNHEMLPVNTVVNAFHYRALVLMAKIAFVLENSADQIYFNEQANKVKATINYLLFDIESGLYVDGEGSKHSSLHSNMFMLAFGLVDESRQEKVIEFIKSRKMACSVYGAQFLLEAMYQSNEDDYALELMTADHDRGWLNMIKAGSTITLEAWDVKYKNNLDWNHAWGAAPANIIPRYLMGLRPLEPGFKKILIKPQTGSLENGKIKLPTVLGPVFVEFIKSSENSFSLDVDLPTGIVARVEIPLLGLDHGNVIVDGKELRGDITENFVVFDNIDSGKHRFERNVEK
ncbi:MAG: alpha-L-rhamnosidase [Planctomycetota bacterium]|nr:MAG: alpha-L-rhamnosidase [Planctomycetota bacterium]